MGREKNAESTTISTHKSFVPHMLDLKSYTVDQPFN